MTEEGPAGQAGIKVGDKLLAVSHTIFPYHEKTSNCTADQLLFSFTDTTMPFLLKSKFQGFKPHKGHVRQANFWLQVCQVFFLGFFRF